MSDIPFIQLNKDGEYKDFVLSRKRVEACPHYILLPEHYREDGTCGCTHQDDPYMKGWEYEWRDGQWR